MDGGTGNDSLDGKGGNDSLYGGPGNDYICGHWGDNIVSGGTGNDELYSVSGHDRFEFAERGPANCDMIQLFAHSLDTIVLKDALDGVTDGRIAGLSFPGGVLSSSWYFVGAGMTGNTPGVYNLSGIYNDTTTGNIWYNPTSGVGGSDSQLICRVVGSTIAASLDWTDFVYSA